ncbi:helix-turn-helix transcriptional regulator [Streptomyces andamanensis]|uniref:Helix-turn-helix transcriptional regulator n=1 Tax=Streptomyces andamanensis TaxID=1565035 RepID=A0ABV8TQB8_9ACTN
MTGVAAAQGNPRRRDVLDVLRSAAGPLGVAETAERTGVHPNTVRFHLDALVAEGRVERRTEEPRRAGRRPGPGRPRTVYAPRPGMDRAGVRGYHLLARMLLAELASRGPGARDAAVRTGRAWGRSLAQPPSRSQPQAVPRAESLPLPLPLPLPTPTPSGPSPTAAESADRLVALLGDLGFDPVSEGSGGDGPPRRIRLRHCPFLELAEEYGELVCPLHLGLMQGALAELGASLTASGLEPFATAESCLAHLAAAPAEAAAAE